MRIFLLCLIASAAAGAQNQDFFIAGSDPQFGMYAKDANFLQETANFEFFIANVNRLKPAFVVITGDLVNAAHNPAQVAEYKRILSRLDSAIPLYSVAGNHDVANEPTPNDLAAYRRDLGPDHYTFLSAKIRGIVIDSSVLAHSKNCPAEAAEQEAWLRAELEKARGDRGRETVVFAHIPLFVENPAEPDSYFNFPKAEREKYVAMLHAAGVRYVFAGHTHHNYDSRDGNLEMVITSAIGLFLGPDPSGFRIADITGASGNFRLEHRFYTLAAIPNRYPPEPDKK